MKTVVAEIPEIYVNYPHCGEETETGRLWTSEDQINVNEGDNGVAICTKCEKSFVVHLDF